MLLLAAWCFALGSCICPAAASNAPDDGIDRVDGTSSIDAGFITVNATAGSALFYWYTPAESGNPAAPTIVWLNGGPGSSSFIGSFGGLGPYALDKTTLALSKRTLGAWSEGCNLLVVDQPVGTGYSYTNASDGYVTTQDEVAADFVVFLKGFFDKHPELSEHGSDLWITGESYAGKYIPAIAALGIIAQGLTETFRFRGVAIGNGLTEPQAMALTMANSYYALGLLDGIQRDHANGLEQACVSLAKNASWAEAAAARDAFLDYIAEVTGGANNEDVRLFHSYNWTFIDDFMNLGSTKALLRIPAGIPPYCVHGCPHVHTSLNDDEMKPYAHLIPTILDRGLKVLLYQGHMDLRDGVAATEAWLPQLVPMWPPMAAWLNSSRSVWRIDGDPSGKVAGYVRTGDNLTQAVVVGAGHIVPMDQPLRAQAMIYRFINGTLGAASRGGEGHGEL